MSFWICYFDIAWSRFPSMRGAPAGHFYARDASQGYFALCWSFPHCLNRETIMPAQRPLQLAIAYAATLCVFLAIDALWLAVLMKPVYAAALG